MTKPPKEENKPIIPFEAWAQLNKMKPTKRARRIWLREEKLRVFFVAMHEKLGIRSAETIWFPESLRPAQKPKASWQKRPAFRWLAGAVAACLICVAVVLPLTLGKGNPGENGSLTSNPPENNNPLTPIEPQKPIRFTDVSHANSTTMEAVRERTLETGQDKKGIMLFSEGACFPNIGEVYYDKPKDLDEPILGYLFADFIVGAADQHENFVWFEFEEYRIRIYKHYDFIHVQLHYNALLESLETEEYDTDFIHSFDINDIHVRYHASGFSSTIVMFLHNEVEYFLKITDGSPVNEESLTIFINSLEIC